MEHVIPATPTTNPGRDAAALGAGATGLGAAAVTIVAATCCVSPVLAPLIVGVLGAGGAAWAAGLKPFSGYILIAALVLLAGGFWNVYRPGNDCVIGRDVSRSRRWMSRLAKVVLGVGAVCWVGAVFVHVVLP